METLVAMLDRQMHERMAWQRQNRMDAVDVIEQIMVRLVDDVVSNRIDDKSYKAIYHTLDRACMHLRLTGPSNESREFLFARPTVPHLPRMTKAWRKANAAYLAAK